MDEEDEVYTNTHNGKLFNGKREWNNAICTNMHGPWDYHISWSMSERVRQTSNDIDFMWNLKPYYKLTYLKKHR